MCPCGGFNDLIIKVANTMSIPGPLLWFGERAPTKRIESMGGIPQPMEKESIMGSEFGQVHLLALPCLRPPKELGEQVFLPDELLTEKLWPGSKTGGTMTEAHHPEALLLGCLFIAWAT